MYSSRMRAYLPTWIGVAALALSASGAGCAHAPTHARNPGADASCESSAGRPHAFTSPLGLAKDPPEDLAANRRAGDSLRDAKDCVPTGYGYAVDDPNNTTFSAWCCARP
jgi:hypothetical protein